MNNENCDNKAFIDGLISSIDDNSELFKKGGISNTPLRTPIEECEPINKAIDTSCNLDYLVFHIEYVRDLINSSLIKITKEFCKIMNLPFAYDEGKGGGSGFRNYIVINEDIHLMYNATFNDEDSELDTIRFDIKGRELELARMRNVKEIDLYNFMKKYNAKVKRVDLANNLYENYITMDEIKEKLDKGEYSSKAKQYEIRNPKDSHGSSIGYTIYIGKPRVSKRYLCIYDKFMESIVHNHINNNLYHVRFELRLEDEYADKFIEEYFMNNCDKKIWNGQFKDFIDFKEYVKNDKNNHKNRLKTWEKWDVFLENCNKYKLKIDKDECLLLDKKFDWLERSVSKTLAIIYLANKYETNKPINIINLIIKLIKNGMVNLDNKDIALINNDLYANGFENNISKESVNKAINEIDKDFEDIMPSKYRYIIFGNGCDKNDGIRNVERVVK